MKNFKYKKHGHPADIKSVKDVKYLERVKGKKRIFLSRLIYLLILLGILVVIIMYLTNQIFFVNGKGVVVSDEYVVRVEEDIVIDSYFKHEADKIVVGDTLFSYQPREQVKLLKEAKKYRQSRKNTFIKEKSNLAKTINLKIIKNKYNKRLYTNMLRQISKLEKEVYLDVSKRTTLEKAELDAIDIKEEIRLTKEEIAYLRTYLNKAEVNYIVAKKEIDDDIKRNTKRQYYLSTVKGKIYEINRTGLVASKNDDILVVNKDEGVVIIANVSQEEMSHVKKGMSINVIFSDKVKSKGIIKQIIEPVVYDGAIDARVVDEMNKIQLKIIPEKGEESKWISRIGYTVKIKKSILF